MLRDPGATGLLSDRARARLTDTRLVEPVAEEGLRGQALLAVALARQFARRVPMRRHPWTPHPLMSDRTRLEYVGAGHA